MVGRRRQSPQEAKNNQRPDPLGVPPIRARIASSNSGVMQRLPFGQPVRTAARIAPDRSGFHADGHPPAGLMRLWMRKRTVMSLSAGRRSTATGPAKT